jgi:hypothetical protein
MKKILLLNLFILLLELACTKDGSNSKISRLYLPTSKWKLTYIQDIVSKDTFNFPVEARQLYGSETISFKEESDTIMIKYLCNNDGYAIYKIFSGNDSIHFSQVFRTQIICEDYFDWEDYLFQNIRDAYKYKMTDSTLSIYSKFNYNLYFVKDNN